MTTKARIAVIGTGWWSTYTHIPALQANLAAELVALCDADDQRLQAAAQAYGVERTYADHQAMLANEALDGIVIATPHATHFQ
nr:Gfo/Idh/MocA family oxidoreductase [Chloroflexota bacterium]